jgi:G3E family GTPase
MTFVFKEILKSRAQELRDQVSSAENLFLNETDLSNIRLQLAQMEMDFKAAQNRSIVARAKRTHDFSKIIKEDLMAMRKRRNELGQAAQSTERLLKPLPRGARALRGGFETLKEEVKHVTAASVETEKSLDGKDWPQSAMVKIKIMELAMMEVKIAVFADRTLTYAMTVRDAAEKLFRLCNRISYALYILGIALGLYAHLAGIRHLMEMK